MIRTKFLIRIYVYFFVLVWFGGFIIFQQYIRKQPVDYSQKTDAIVVLTGGKNRIHEAVQLYNENLADILFISGVGKHVNVRSLEQQHQIHFMRNTNNVWLGREATNTIENAIEVSEVIRRNNLKSIRLVTSYYHMPRSVEVIKALTPDVKILEHPVYSPNVSKRWWKRPKSFYLIASEYHKFLFVYIKNLILNFI